jgi:hypothetical protein
MLALIPTSADLYPPPPDQRTSAKNLSTILLRSAIGPRAVLAMLTYPTYAALALLRHEPPAFTRGGS